METIDYEKKRRLAAERKVKRLEKRVFLFGEKKKKKSLRELKKELKRVTHAIVRLTYDNCYSCDKYVPLKERQAGHYYTDGGNPGTRYDFNNLRTQHANCNYYLGGDAHYGARLLKEIGQEAFLELDRKRKINPGWKHQDFEALIEERKKILVELQNNVIE